MTDTGTRYVVVYNKIGIRHIVTYHYYKDREDFFLWYYKEYQKMDGDKIRIYKKISNAIEFAKKKQNMKEEKCKTRQL